MDQLPYLRQPRKNGMKRFPIAADPIQTATVREIAPERLLATKRIVNAFNAGDIESICDIVNECTVDFCEIQFSTLNHVFTGKLALISLWSSIFSAFPNGIFRTSDSVIDNKKQVFTSFLFHGAEIFPLSVDNTHLEDLVKEADVISPQLIMKSALIAVDQSNPFYTSTELLNIEKVPDLVFEGRIIISMNEDCKIRKFDFSWNKKL